MGLFSRKQRVVPVVIDQVAHYDEPLQDACSVVEAGSWRPAAALLQESADRATRQFRIDAFAGRCIASTEWIKDWQRAEPADFNAQIVWACAGPILASHARGTLYAEHTEPEQFERLQQVLDETEGFLTAALQHDPSEASLWIAALWHGVLAGVDKGEFASRWKGLLQADPDSRLGHNAALQYKSAKWYGSDDEMYAFARQVSDAAPVGSPQVVAVLQAHIERWMRMRDQENASPAALDAFMGSDQVNSDIDTVVKKWLEVEGSDSQPNALHDKSVVAFLLCHAGRWDEAAALFDAMEHRVYEYPWYYCPDDTLPRLHGRAMKSVGA